ncbi:hypothetical protein BG015_003425, partial [Linnemannia schmuckeri]
TIGIKDLLQKTQDSGTMQSAQNEGDDDGNNNNDNDDSALDKPSLYIQLPALKDLTLRGSWVLDTQVLEILCRVAPNVIRLSLEGCSGFSLADWISTTSRHLMSLVNASASIPVTAGLSSSVGLVEMDVSRGDAGGATWYQLGQLPEAAQLMILRIHPALLAQSPSLIYVTLDDRQGRDSLTQTVVYWKPAKLPRLTSLILTGTPAISFYPGMLRSTRNLDRLGLHVYAFQNGPPAPIAVSKDDDVELAAVG